MYLYSSVIRNNVDNIFRGKKRKEYILYINCLIGYIIFVLILKPIISRS